MLLNSPRTKLFITGYPGVGKTTLTEYLWNFLNKNQNLPFKLYGFITKELKKNKERQGFKIKVLGSGEEFLLAKKKSFFTSQEIKDKPCLGRYVVFLKDLERLITLFYEKLKKEKSFFIIDEIGKMEAFSEKFCNFINEVLSSKHYLLATVGLSDLPFLKKVRSYEPAFMCMVTKENRDFLRKRLELEFLRKGKLLVIEGIDGAGKTTISNVLFKVLKNKGINCILSTEPTSGPYGKKLREVLKKGGVSPFQIKEYFLKDRLWHVKNIVIPALDQGKWVVLDRYYLSTIAYQGAQGLNPKELFLENETIAPTPDLVIFLDVSVDQALKRINIRDEELSIFEKKEFLKKVEGTYKRYLPWFNYLIVDARDSVEKIINKILKFLDSELKSSFS